MEQISLFPIVLPDGTGLSYLMWLNQHGQSYKGTYDKEIRKSYFGGYTNCFKEYGERIYHYHSCGMLTKNQ